MKKLIIFIAVISFFACNKEVELGPPGPWNINTVFFMSVYNSDDEEMLNPSTPNHFDSDNIKLFYEVDGELKRTTNAEVEQWENEYVVRLFLNDSNTSGKSITYIQWSRGDTDTLEAVFRRTEYIVEKRTVWLNSMEIWDWKTDDVGYYKLIK